MIKLSPWLWLASFAWIVLASGTPVFAIQIVWQSERGQPHLKSDGEAIDGSFVFELGAFEEGFVPSLSNVTEWAQNWQGLQRTIYDPVSASYTNRHDMASNDPPFALGGPGYVWGFGVDTNEWILMTDASWKWPGVGGTGFPVSWSTRNANDIRVGAILSAGGLQTQDVGPADSPILGPEAWRMAAFTDAERQDETISGWEIDPDGDGYTNLVEYALVGDPLVYDEGLSLSVTAESPGLARATLVRNRGRFASVKMQSCSDLVSWVEMGNRLRDDWDVEEASIDWLDRLFVRVHVEVHF